MHSRHIGFDTSDAHRKRPYQTNRAAETPHLKPPIVVTPLELVVTCHQRLIHKGKQAMTTDLFDKCVSVSSSTEIANPAITEFEDKGFKVRVIMRDGEPWFVAKDVCDCLDLGNVSQT